jgi:hypothetical protein
VLHGAKLSTLMLREDFSRVQCLEAVLADVVGRSNSFHTSVHEVARFFGRQQRAQELLQSVLMLDRARMVELIHETAVDAAKVFDEVEADAAKGLSWKKANEGCFARLPVSAQVWYNSSSFRPTIVGLSPAAHLALRLCRQYHVGWKALPTDLFRLLVERYIIPHQARHIIAQSLLQVALSEVEIEALLAHRRGPQ